MSITAIFIVGIIVSLLFSTGVVLLLFAKLQPPNSSKYKTLDKSKRSLVAKEQANEQVQDKKTND